MISQNNLSVYFVKESNQNKSLQFWVGTQSEYDLIQNKKDNTYYIITDREGGNFSGDFATDDEILALLIETGIVDPAAVSEVNYYTDENNSIYLY